MRNDYEKEMVDCFGGPTGDRAFCMALRRSGDAFVELAAADAVRMAAHYVLAGSWTAGSVPDSVRRLGWWFEWLQIPVAQGRAVAADDARRAREVPRMDAQPLWRLWSTGQRNQGVRLTALTSGQFTNRLDKQPRCPRACPERSQRVSMFSGVPGDRSTSLGWLRPGMPRLAEWSKVPRTSRADRTKHPIRDRVRIASSKPDGLTTGLTVFADSKLGRIRPN